MNNKGFVATIILQVAVALFVVGGLWLFKMHQEGISTAIPSASSPVLNFEVLYTADGFVSSTLDVPLGARITFLNMTKAPLKVASNPYPTHTDYPAFVADRDYAKGESYVFMFTQGGTFGYQNDDKPTDHGTIHVEDPANPVPDISKTVQAWRAARDKLAALFVPNDPNSIFAVIDAIQADQKFSLDCHDIAHDIGHRAYELYGFSSAMTYDNASSVDHTSVMDICAGGYVHGVLEEMSLHQPDFAKDPGAMCANVPTANRASCFHGVGHALMFANERDVPASLAGCRSLDRVEDRTRCFEGVWMEMFWGSTEHAGANSLGWDLAKPLAPCIATQQDAKQACFLYSTFGYLRTHPHDYTGAVKLCTESGLNANDSAFCLRGVGITMVSHLKGTHLERSETFAVDFTPAEKLSFYRGVMGYARLSGIGDDELQNACAAMKTDADVCAKALVVEP